MDMVFLYILVLAIFIETTFLVVKNSKTQGVRGGKRKIYVDTSALMDGRILEIAKTGFLGDDLFIPRSVIRELQLLADGKDSEKRTRARFGMELASELERVIYCNTEILEDRLDRTPVDERLIELAKKNHGMIITCDFNLQKVAETEKIEVLNPNELANKLRPEFVPGDKITVKISGQGQNPKQGVGYLPDGTMVVVNNASEDVGKEINATFGNYLQTNAGRMLFADKTRTRRTKEELETIRKNAFEAKARTNQPRTRKRGRGSSK